MSADSSFWRPWKIKWSAACSGICWRLEPLFISEEQRQPLTVVVAGKDVVTLLSSGLDRSDWRLMSDEEALWQFWGIDIYCSALRFWHNRLWKPAFMQWSFFWYFITPWRCCLVYCWPSRRWLGIRVSSGTCAAELGAKLYWKLPVGRGGIVAAVCSPTVYISLVWNHVAAVWCSASGKSSPQ